MEDGGPIPTAPDTATSTAAPPPALADPVEVATVEPSPPARPVRDVLALPSFRRYWAAQLFTSISSGSSRFVFVWLALELSDSPAAAGVAAMALGLPQLVMMVPFGAVSDRVDRRRLLVRAQLALGVVFAVAAAAVWTDVMTLTLECVLALATGVLVAAILPSLQVMPALLVPKDRLMTAAAVQGLGMNSAMLLGPAIGGASIAVAGIGGAFATLTALQLGATIAMSRVRVTHSAPAGERHSVARGIADGIRYTSSHEPVRSLVLVAWVVGLSWSVMFVLLPETSRDELGVGALATSLLFTAVGLGLLSMSITLAARQPSRPGRIISVALVIGPGVATAAVGLSRLYVLTLALAYVVGAGAGATTVLQRGLLQRKTPTELLGRVMSMSALGLMGSFPIAAGIAAILSATVGPPNGITVIGVTTILTALALGLRAPLRNA